MLQQGAGRAQGHLPTLVISFGSRSRASTAGLCRVQLISVDADVELEPVGIGVHGRLPGGQRFILKTLMWPAQIE